MRDSLKYMGRVITAVGLVGLAGCNKEVSKPKRTDYNSGQAPIMESYSARDLDLDGNVDVITGKGMGAIDAYWIAEGEEELLRKYGISFDTIGKGTTRRMTPRMRAVTSKLVANHNNTLFEMDKSRYDAQKARKSEIKEDK